MLRSVLTPELTSAKTILRFLPELNQVNEDFISLLRTTRDKQDVISGFEEFANRMGLESEFIFQRFNSFTYSTSKTNFQAFQTLHLPFKVAQRVCFLCSS